MFTGIVRHVGVVVSASATPAGRRLTVDLGPLAHGLRPGQSVCVCGVCLTAARTAGVACEFDVIGETLARTRLGELRPGEGVNLEPALAAGEPLDGHIVQGHVDGIATLRRVERGAGWLAQFECPRELTDEMAPKGSVALDGVSLTLAQVGQGTFAVALIPETLSRTTLGKLAPGGRVNVETDIIGKYVRKMLLSRSMGPLTMERLREAGF
jgi:riboflavin synthase